MGVRGMDGREMFPVATLRHWVTIHTTCRVKVRRVKVCRQSVQARLHACSRPLTILLLLR